MKWKPISTAPKDKTTVLLYIEDCVIEGYWNPSYEDWVVPSLSSHGCGCCASSNEAPKFWMKYPKQPNL